jgi:hypothetical protein
LARAAEGLEVMGPLIRSGVEAEAADETRTAARKIADGKKNGDTNPRNRIKRKLLEPKILEDLIDSI